MALFSQLIVANRLKSILLVLVFIVLLTLAVAAVILSFVLLGHGWAVATRADVLVPAILASAGLAGLLALALSLGAEPLLRSRLGARPVDRRDDPALWNVVEEMALASGQPMPRVFRIDEGAANALAVGLSPRRSTLVVTSGLEEVLDRDELQAVVAHAFARIRLYDVQLMTLMAALVGFLSLLAEDLEARAAYCIRGPGPLWLRFGASVLALGAVFMLPLVLVVLLLAPLAGRLIQLAASRQRLYLADAQAARLTRYPGAVARALVKLSAGAKPLWRAGRATAHLFIVPPILRRGRRPGGKGMFSSHPPLADRVARLHLIGQLQE